MRENQFHVAEIALLLLRLEANFLLVFPYVREQKRTGHAHQMFTAQRSVYHKNFVYSLSLSSSLWIVISHNKKDTAT